MNEYSCQPAPIAGHGCFALRIDFEYARWIEGKPTMGIRGLIRARTFGGSDRVEFDSADILNAIRELEARCEVMQ